MKTIKKTILNAIHFISADEDWREVIEFNFKNSKKTILKKSHHFSIGRLQVCLNQNCDGVTHSYYCFIK